MNTERMVYGGSVLLFLWFIWYSQASGVTAYMVDGLVSIGLVTIAYVLRKKLRLTSWLLLFITISMMLHNFGVFGFYVNSPINMQWDHVTHFVWFFALSLILLRYSEVFIVKSQFNKVMLVILVVLANLGVGVFVEFYELIGFLTVGEGLGGLGHGAGDIITEIGNSEWFNTIFDLGFNLLGTLVGLAVYFGLMRRPWKRVHSSRV